MSEARVCLKAYVSTQEAEAVRSLASRLGFSVSALLRQLATGYTIPQARTDAGAIRQLLKINADLARLGNLLKMTLDDDTDPAPLIDDIRTTQALLKAHVLTLKDGPEAAPPHRP